MITKFSNKVVSAIFAFTTLCGISSAFSQDGAYLGVSGYITSVSHGLIIETTTASSYSDDTPSVSKGFKIRSVQHGSPAFHAGLKCGDILIEAHGIFINNYSSLSRMRRALARTDSMEVYFVRHGNLESTWVGNVDTVTTTVR